MEWFRMCCKWGGCERKGGWGCCGNCLNVLLLLIDVLLLLIDVLLMGGVLAKGLVVFGDG